MQNVTHGSGNYGNGQKRNMTCEAVPWSLFQISAAFQKLLLGWVAQLSNAVNAVSFCGYQKEENSLLPQNFENPDIKYIVLLFGGG